MKNLVLDFRFVNFWLTSILFMVYAVLTVSLLHAQNRKVDLRENLPFEEVLQRAGKEKKYIFLDFGSITCKPCLYLKKEVFTIDSVADFINERFVSVDYNNGKEKDRLRKHYNVIGEPVLLILDTKGNFMHRMVGRMSAGELLARFRQGLDPSNNIVAQDKKYAEGNRDGAFILSYLETLFAASETDKMNAVLKEYLSGPLENLKEKKYWDVFYRYNEDILSREMLYVFDNRQEFYKLFGQQKLDAKINTLYSAKARAYLYGHKAPAENPAYHQLVSYLQQTDYPLASEWLVYLLPAGHKYKDWAAMAKEINNAYSYNIIKGGSSALFKQMMITQYEMYCDDPNGLKYAVQWCDDLKAGADSTKIASMERSKVFLANKAQKLSTDTEEKLEWTEINEKGKE